MSPDAARPCAAIPPLPGSLASRAAGARARVPLGMRCSAAGSMGPQTSSLSLASRLLRRRPPPQTCWCASIARRRSAARALVGDAGRFRAGAAVAQMTQNVRDLIACKHAGAQCETAPSGHYSRSASRAGRRSSGALRAAGGESERKLRARPRALRCTTWRAVGHAAPRQLAACCARGIALLVTCACHMNPPCELGGACFFSRARGGGLAQRGRARAEFGQPRDDPHALSSHRDATSRGSGSRGEQPRVAPRDGGLESTSAGTETPARRLRDDDAKRSARRLPRSQRAHFR